MKSIFHNFVILHFLSIYSWLVRAQEVIPMSFTMEEHTGSGYRVGSIADRSKPYHNLSTTQLNSLMYNIDSESALQSIFLVNGNGELKTQVDVDREDVCSNIQISEDCVLSFSIGALLEGKLEFIATVNVIVEDKNDNTPYFSERTPKTIQIPEGTVGAEYPIPRAKDDDKGGNNGILTYRLLPNDGIFQLTTEDTLLGLKPKLLVNTALDRENKSSYELQVIATDGGDIPKSAILNLIVEVTDLNDNPPRFDRSEYNVTIEEDTEANTSILNVSATDIDANENGQVSYKINEEQANAAEILRLFTIDEKSGSVTIKQTLQYKQGESYEFIVQAFDHGDPVKSSDVKVFVYVRDTGNGAPRVTLSLWSQGSVGFANISESAGEDTFVALVKVEDTDSGLNGFVTCDVIDNDFFGAKAIPDSSKQFNIVVNGKLDRETKDMHNVTVVCHDYGTPQLSSDVSFLVRITDANDEKPVFEQSDYIVEPYENIPVGSVIWQVSATDDDLSTSPNSMITYSTQSPDFEIDRLSGIIKSRVKLDREKTPEIVFRVFATDKGNPPLTGTATVTLRVQDENDCPPRFDYRFYVFETMEGLDTGTTVGVVTASDNDTEPNSHFAFSINTSADLPFVLLGTGLLKLNSELDREAQSRYDFPIIVRDERNSSLFDRVKVTVLVTDINDNAPEFTFPTSSNKSVSILYPDGLNYVTRIMAQDPDAGENQTLKFSITDGNEQGIFRIEENTGRIFVAKIVPIDSDQSVTLNLFVSDSGKTPLNSSGTLEIRMLYSNATAVPVKESSNKYIVISVVVVILTLLISVAIVAGILFLRKLDNKKKTRQNSQRSTTDSDCGFSDTQQPVFVLKSEENSSDNSSQESKKRKEVSFSLNESFDGFAGELRVVNFPDLQNGVKYYGLGPRQPETIDDKDKTRMEMLKLQQIQMETKQWIHAQPIQHSHPEDSRSETSGETIPSTDSGRGGSEEDMPSTSPSADDDHKTFEFFTSNNNNFTKNNTDSTPHVYPNSAQNRGGNSTPGVDPPPPIPHRSYKQYSSFSDHGDRSGLNNYKGIPNRQYYSTRQKEAPILSWPTQNFVHNNWDVTDYGDFSFPSVPSTLRSRDDDEYSTTTSGSYTLQADDIL